MNIQIGSQMSKYTIRNSIAVGACITLIVILFIFYSGSNLYEKIQGEWVCIESSDSLIFINKEYIHNSESGPYRIYGNKIVFLEPYNEYLIDIKKDYLIFNGALYLKKQ